MYSVLTPARVCYQYMRQIPMLPVCVIAGVLELGSIGYLIYYIRWRSYWFYHGYYFINCRHTYVLSIAIPLAVICSLYLLIQLIWMIVHNAHIQRGVSKIADGDIHYQLSMPRCVCRQQELIIHEINSIGEGLQSAVKESVRNERMKTELITNVSHDIKTPLTSIINYVDLLKREQLPSEEARGYLEILDQKSQRLKVMIEDLVEASKASSGAIDLQITSLNFNELLLQTNGEFTERFEGAKLTLICEMPEESVVFQGDGRRVYRILENLYSNVAKYAMPNTRVYASLSQKQDSKGESKLEFTLKNISAMELNITPEELTERFVRGEKSRATEGSGLGLAIAKSLTELMGGRFTIHLDGDLFCVQLEFIMDIEDKK